VSKTSDAIQKKLKLENPQTDWGFISTGLYGLDSDLGGGLAKGKIIEIFGPESSAKTTLCLSAAAVAQRAGGDVLFIDSEHAIDPGWAIKNGVDWDEFGIIQPDTAEQALEAVELAIEMGTDLIILDSVAAMSTRRELEGDLGDANVGDKARLMSQVTRRLASKANRSGSTVVFINQIREKIGVMFGCFSYSSKVKLSDGSSMEIGKIVNQKTEVEVLAWDAAEQKIVSAKVIDWHNNGRTDNFIQVKMTKGWGRGISTFTATEDHEVFTPDGTAKVGDLKPGDEVLGRVSDRTFTDDQWQMVLGSLLGDGSIRPGSRSKAQLRIGHGLDQTDYCVWKHDVLEASSFSKGQRVIESALSSHYLQQFLPLQGRKQSKCTIPTDLIDTIDARGVAIWYLDDGSLSGSHEKWGAGKAVISVKSIQNADATRLAERCSKIGLGRAVYSEKFGRLQWFGQEARLFFNGIGSYVPECMRHKVPDYAPEFVDGWDNERSSVVDLLLSQEVISTSLKAVDRSPFRYDITEIGRAHV